MCLISIFIPKNQRGKGLCSSILGVLEKRSKQEKVGFVVSPLMDYGQTEGEGGVVLEKILIKRGYKTIPPFSMEYTEK